MKYYLSDQDYVFAIDNSGKEYAFNLKEKRLKEVPKGTINPLWGGCTESYAKKRMADLSK